MGPAFAGWGNISIKKFWFYDTLAIFFYTPLVILVGFYFNHNLDIIRSRLISAKHIIFILFLTLVGLAAAYFANKNFSEWDFGSKPVCRQAGLVYCKLLRTPKLIKLKKIIRINPRTNFRECLLNIDIVSF